jgi:hypothetical protein
MEILALLHPIEASLSKATLRRGLKHIMGLDINHVPGSLPTRGAWIETT